MNKVNSDNSDKVSGIPVSNSGDKKLGFEVLAVEALNAKILKITLIIKAKFPELSKFLEEMPVDIPNEKNLQISLEELNEYYRSLEAVLSKYTHEHPKG